MAFDHINDPNGYHARKAERTEYFRRNVFGWRLRVCGCCNGSGYYDSTDRFRRAIKCGNCYGTGKERYQAR